MNEKERLKRISNDLVYLRVKHDKKSIQCYICRQSLISQLKPKCNLVINICLYFSRVFTEQVCSQFWFTHSFIVSDCWQTYGVFSLRESLTNLKRSRLRFTARLKTSCPGGWMAPTRQRRKVMRMKAKQFLFLWKICFSKVSYVVYSGFSKGHDGCWCLWRFLGWVVPFRVYVDSISESLCMALSKLDSSLYLA